MNIVHIVPYFQPSYGYEEFYHAFNHARLGANVTVITSKYYHPNLVGKLKKLVPREEDDNLTFNVVRLNSIEIGYAAQNILLGLNDAIMKVQPNALYLHGPECIAYCFVAKSIKRKIPTLIDVHKDGGGRIRKYNYLTNFLAMIKKKIIVANLSDCNRILFFSSDHKSSYLRGINPSFEKISLSSFMPVDISTFRRDELVRSKFRIAHNIGDGDTLVVITGRLTREKYILETLLALKNVTHKNIYIYLAGDIDDDYLDEIEKSCGELFENRRMRVFPKLSNIYLAELYNACDYALWPFHMSVGILEALSCGATVLTNKRSKDYYQAIPDYGVIEGGLDCYVDKILLGHNVYDLERRRINRELNALAVSDLTYENLARFTIELLGNHSSA